MKKNMSNLDRGLRTLFAVVVALLYFNASISGAVAVVLGIFAVLMLLSSLAGSCWTYTLIGISTLKKEK